MHWTQRKQCVYKKCGYQNFFETLVSKLCYKFSHVKLSSKLMQQKMIAPVIFVQSGLEATCRLTTPTVARPGNVNCFWNKIILKQSDKDILAHSFLAYVSWYKEHEEQYHLHSPIIIWSVDVKPLSFASFMPISRILCRCVQEQTKVAFC